MMPAPLSARSGSERPGILYLIVLVALPLVMGMLLMWGLSTPALHLDRVNAAVVNDDVPVTINGTTTPLGRQFAAVRRYVASRNRRDRESRSNREPQSSVGVAGVGDTVGQPAILERFDGIVAAPAVAVVQRDRDRSFFVHRVQDRRNPHCRIGHHHLPALVALPLEDDCQIQFTRRQ